MTGDEEPSRVAAQVLIDMLSVLSDLGDADDDAIADATRVAFRRILDANAIHVSGRVVDVTPLLNGSLVLMDWLLNELTRTAARDRDEILVRLREHVDAYAKPKSD